MDRINRILNHPLFQNCTEQIAGLEESRIFCGHDMSHLLDVARLAYIFTLEEGLGMDRERIYAAALLHDIGRHIQYLEGTPHQEAGLPLAKEILADCGFSAEESREISEAIGRHRDKTAAAEKNLSGVLYRADKMSRSCFSCAAEKECDWSREKKNLALKY